MACANCTGDDDAPRQRAAAAAAAVAAASSSSPSTATLTPMCQHAAGSMCVHCAPGDTELADAYAARHARLPRRDPRRSCRNHGPHGSCTDCVAADDARLLRLTRQATSASRALTLDTGAGQAFLQTSIGESFRRTRVGLLFGRQKKSGTTVAEVIFEVEPSPAAGGVDETSPVVARATKLAELLGIERVGTLVATRSSRLTGAAVVAAAHSQRVVGPRAVLAHAHLNDAGAAVVEPYQLADAAVLLDARGAFEGVEQPALDAAAHGHELFNSAEAVYVEKAAVHAAAIDFLLVPLPIKSSGKAAFLTSFPSPAASPSSGDVAAHLMAHADAPLSRRLKDFALLYYLSSVLDMEVEMPSLCEAVRNGRDEALEGFYVIIQSLSTQ